jgi:hypothetical protein
LDSEQIVKRGRKAETVLKDELLTEAFESIKKDQLSIITSSNVADSEKRESAYYMMKAVELLQIKLNSFYQDGKFEERKIKK